MVSQTVSGFSSDITTYNVELPSGTTSAPEVLATVTDLGKENSVVTPALNLLGSTKILVSAEDGITIKTYTINFTVVKNVTIDENNTETSNVTVENEVVSSLPKTDHVKNTGFLILIGLGMLVIGMTLIKSKKKFIL